MHRPTRLLILSAIVFVSALAISAQNKNQSGTRNMQKEMVIVEQLHAVAPGSVDDFIDATRALDNQSYEESAKLFQKVVDKAPNFSPALRRLGMSLVLSGKRDEGMNYLESAATADASPENLISLAEMLAYPGKDKEASTADKERALTMAKHALDLRKEDDPDYEIFIAQLS